MIDRDQFRMTLLAHSAQRPGGHWIGKGSSIDVRLAEFKIIAETHNPGGYKVNKFNNINDLCDIIHPLLA